MQLNPKVFSKQLIGKKSWLFVFIIFSNIALVRGFSSTEELSLQTPLIEIVEGTHSLFGGINSIRAEVGSSAMGILYRTNDTPNPLYLFTQFTQKIAKIKILNSRGTYTENQTELVVQNTILMALESIIEFTDTNNDSKLNINEITSVQKFLDLSKVQFKIKKFSSVQNTTSTTFHYKISFYATDVPYNRFRENEILENLTITFDFNVATDDIIIKEIPVITIRQVGKTIEISKNIENTNLAATKHQPRLKFSLKISGWDYSSTSSKLLLKIKTLAHESLLALGRVSKIQITREVLKSSDLLGKLRFVAESSGTEKEYSVNQGENQTVEYPDHLLEGLKISLGNSLRSFMNFTWAEKLFVDGEERMLKVQVFDSGERIQRINPFQSSFDSSTIYLNIGFIFNKGSELYYDPELQVEEINPSIRIITPPNRTIIPLNSILVLFSGFFIGIVIVIRHKASNYL